MGACRRASPGSRPDGPGSPIPAADAASIPRAPAVGFPNEASDDAMAVVYAIEEKLRLAYAPDGTPHFTWRGSQDAGLLIDEALDRAYAAGFGDGIERAAKWAEDDFVGGAAVIAPAIRGLVASETEAPSGDETGTGSAEGEGAARRATPE